MKQLLVVEGHLKFSSIDGITVLPDFDVPDDIGMAPFSNQAVVQHPDGTETKRTIEFNMLHGSNSAKNIHTRRILVTLPQATKETVPVGSKILVSDDVLKKIKTYQTPTQS